MADLQSVKDAVEQLTATVNSMRMVQDSLVMRVMKLESEKSEKKDDDDEIHVCVQCGAKYTNSKNPPGSCEIHPGRLASRGWDMEWSCCNKRSGDYEGAYSIPGCTSTGVKHRQKHHVDYSYHRYYYWLNNTRNKEFAESWTRIEQIDFEDHKTAFIDVGLLKNGSLYVLAGKGGRGDFLTVVSPEELGKIDNDAYIYNVTGEYITQAQWIVDQGHVTGIRLAAKSTSDEEAHVVKVMLQLAGDKLVKTGVETISGAPKTIKDIIGDDTLPSMPAPVREGPVIEQPDTPTPTRHECVSNTVVKVVQADALVQPGQSFTRGDSFTQFLTSEFTVTNPGAKTSVQRVTSEWCNNDNEWVTCDGCQIGVAGTDWRGGKIIDWDESGNTAFNIDEKASLNIAISASISTKGQGGNDNASRSRVHKSYPSPLLIRTTFTDVDDSNISIITECVNKPLDLPNKADRAKSWGKDVIDWIQVDDVIRDDRIYMATYEDDGYVIRAWHGTYWTLSTDDYMLWAYQARKQSVTVLPLDQFNKDAGNGVSCRIYALCDADHGYLPYSLKIVLKTETSSVEECVSVPLK